MGAEYHRSTTLDALPQGLMPGVLTAAEGYRRWAPQYEAETAISAIEDELVRSLTPDLSNARLLDAGCGTGRRLASAQARHAIGIDASAEMIAQCRERENATRRFAVGDVRALPVADRGMDVVWCRLVLGHLPEIDTAYRELARVTAPGGTIAVSDFHAAAWRAGHRRTFRDADGVHEIVHFVHDADVHRAAAERAGLIVETVREGVIGPLVQRFYARAGRGALYAEHRGLPVVLALRLGKAA